MRNLELAVLRYRKARDITILGMIFALAVLLTLHQLGRAEVCSYNEAVEGMAVQQIVERGAFFARINVNPSYKPPLFHLTSWFLDKALGIHKVTPFNLRLPSALYASAGILLAIVFSYVLSGITTSLLTGLILLGSYQYIAQGRFGRVDMTLTFFETAALLGAAMWLRSLRLREAPGRQAMWRYGFALSAGLGVLAKGPVGALLPLGAVLVHLAARRDWSATKNFLLQQSTVVLFLVASAWYVICYLSGRHDFLSRQIGSENFGRYFGSLGSMPIWYYLAPLLLNSVPLSLFAPLAVIAAYKSKADNPQQDQTLFEIGRLLATFWVVTVVFFTVAAYKRRSYLLPLWPSAAILIALAITRADERWRQFAGMVVAIVCVALAIFNFEYLPRKESSACAGEAVAESAAQITRIVGVDEPLFIYGLGQEPAALLFYLDRYAQVWNGQLGDAPPGYVIVPAKVWLKEREHAPGLEAVFGPGSGSLVLLRHGKAYAGSPAAPAIKPQPESRSRNIASACGWPDQEIGKSG